MQADVKKMNTIFQMRRKFCQYEYPNGMGWRLSIRVDFGGFCSYFTGYDKVRSFSCLTVRPITLTCNFNNNYCTVDIFPYVCESRIYFEIR